MKIITFSSCFNLILAVLGHFIGVLTAQADDYCNCGYYEEYPWAGPYCATWIEGDPLFCFLNGGSNASSCPGAKKWGDENLFQTKDQRICERSSNFSVNYCNCANYELVDWVGPYCAKWIDTDPPFCYLAGGSLGQFCPGAVQYGDEDLYWTEDKDVCNRSNNFTVQYCNCAYQELVDWVGSYCAKWIETDPPFCFLSSGPHGKFCPGANQWGDEELYWTEDEDVCERSNNFNFQNCSCGYYEKYERVGPYCSNWSEGQPAFCLLHGGSTGRFCPGANQLANESLYWTSDVEICERSSNYTLEHCYCGHYQQYKEIKPFCSRWIDWMQPFCFLSGGSQGRFCPGAVQLGNEI